MIPVLYSINLT